MSIATAFRKLSASSTTAILHTSAPCAARSPIYVLPSVPPPCAESATIRHWDDQSPTSPTRPFAVPPYMSRNASDELRTFRAQALKRRESATEQVQATIPLRDNQSSVKQSSSSSSPVAPHMQRHTSKELRIIRWSLKVAEEQETIEEGEESQIDDDCLAVRDVSLARTRAMRRKQEKIQLAMPQVAALKVKKLPNPWSAAQKSSRPTLQ
ncbi:hypothetical protein R3P38DRAFT_3165828 [Favolaschia claudopus]|uniref:Uncharacterized protein n=1 Tax=Favolaschia claudopus TaxID=2862362 RepID=A0AAW0EKE8_9AGAR